MNSQRAIILILSTLQFLGKGSARELDSFQLELLKSQLELLSEEHLMTIVQKLTAITEEVLNNTDAYDRKEMALNHETAEKAARASHVLQEALLSAF